MSNYLITEVNCKTGEVIERELTAEEQKQRTADDLLYLETKKIQQEKKVTAEAKLAALGLTIDDLKALGL